MNINVIEPNSFAFQRIPILQGRTFTTADRPESPRVIVVNETMARQWRPGENPIGKTAWLGCKSGSRTPSEVADSKYGSLGEAPLPVYFVHWRQVSWNGFFALMLHTSGDPKAIAEPLRKLAQTGGANLRIYEFRSFDAAIGLTLARAKWQAFLLSAFNVLAMLLAASGLYGVAGSVYVCRVRAGLDRDCNVGQLYPGAAGDAGGSGGGAAL